MKKMIVSCYILTLFGLASCVQADSTNCGESSAYPCIDYNAIDSAAICTAQYDPVCGCDDVTYSNSCEAEKNGVMHYVEGECCD